MQIGDLIKPKLHLEVLREPKREDHGQLEVHTRWDDPQKEFIVALGDRIPIEKDYEILTAQKIQPRFTTSIPKIQYDLYQ